MVGVCNDDITIGTGYLAKLRSSGSTMHTFIYLLSTFVAKVIDIVGIGSFIAGLFVRSPAVLLGWVVVFSIAEIIIMAELALGPISAIGVVVTPFAGLICGFSGWAIRRRKKKSAAD